MEETPGLGGTPEILSERGHAFHVSSAETQMQAGRHREISDESQPTNVERVAALGENFRRTTQPWSFPPFSGFDWPTIVFGPLALFGSNTNSSGNVGPGVSLPDEPLRVRRHTRLNHLCEPGFLRASHRVGTKPAVTASPEMPT